MDALRPRLFDKYVPQSGAIMAPPGRPPSETNVSVDTTPTQSQSQLTAQAVNANAKRSRGQLEDATPARSTRQRKKWSETPGNSRQSKKESKKLIGRSSRLQYDQSIVTTEAYDISIPKHCKSKRLFFAWFRSEGFTHLTSLPISFWPSSRRWFLVPITVSFPTPAAK